MSNRDKLIKVFGATTGILCMDFITDKDIDGVMNTSISDAQEAIHEEMPKNSTVGDLVDWMLSTMDSLVKDYQNEEKEA